MEKLLYFFIHLGIPILIIAALLVNRARSKVGFLLGKIFQITSLIFLYQWGQYPMVGSYYLRYVILAIVAIALLLGWRRWSLDLTLFPRNWRSWTITILLVLSIPLLTYLNYHAYTGIQSGIIPMADLEFPLKNGLYYVSSGGTTAVANNHFRNYPNSQQYAIDVNQLNPMGSVSANVLSNSSDKHIIFGQQVCSPCTGVVMNMRNDVADNSSTSMTVDHEYGRGNSIDLDCDGLVVSMSHLRVGSIRVKTGDRVWTGQPLARVGNSGFSQEPHLHIQAARYAADSSLIGVPVSFDNRWLVRNMLVATDDKE